MKNPLAFFFGLLLPFFARTQDFHAEKWGKIPDEDLAMTVYPQDSTAGAVILQDVGYIDVNPLSQGWTVSFAFHRRIKVFDLNSFDQGNLKIVYPSDLTDAKLEDVDVQLILPNGEKQKVKSDNVFTEKLGRYYKAKKIFIPNLQKGSIIEYRYDLRLEDITGLVPWFFQNELPVRWSEITLMIPSIFEYVYLLSAPREFDVKKSEIVRQSGGGLTYNAVKSIYGLKHMPAIKVEPHITTLENYMAHIRFQLNKINYASGTPKMYMTTWAEVAKQLEEARYFGNQYLKNNRCKKIWDAFVAETGEQTPKGELPEKIMRFVSKNVKWNELYGTSPNEELDDVFEKKTGSTDDINMMVVALLRKAGFEARPVLLSTRYNGVMFSQYPFLSQFNSLIACYKEGDAYTLIDATDPFHALGELQPQHYNGSGWVVDESAPHWLEIPSPEEGYTWFGEMSLEETGIMKGKFNIGLNGPAASLWRTWLSDRKASKVLTDQFANGYANIEFDSIVIENEHDLNKPLRLSFKCTVPNAATVVDNFIYCKPVLDFDPESNPFKSLKRIYPVEFIFPLKSHYIINLALPPGYSVEELPEPARINLENNGGKIQFTCSKISEQSVQLVMKMNLSKLLFTPVEYDGLRKFHDLIDDKMQMQLVLKKG